MVNLANVKVAYGSRVLFENASFLVRPGDKIGLAKILLLNPDVLLIDEPTNHLDIESIIWLESWLKDFKGALVMTSHDREFMTRICSRTVEVAGETSREVLLEALQEFDGTIIIVSHDRYFLKHLVNRVFEVDHGALRIYEGDYDYYQRKIAERQGQIQ